jgi:membrane fusion protein, multidrug efflux system
MRKSVIFGLGLAASLAVGLIWLQRGGPKPRSAVAANAAAGPLAVQVVQLTPESIELEVPGTGRLLARESVELVSELPRRLVRVRAEEGTQVSKGEVLFELDAADLRAELVRLEVQARLARSTLDRTAQLVGEGLGNRSDLDLAQARFDELAAQRKSVEVTLSKTQIVAPFSGELGLRRVSEGAMLSANTVLATLQDSAALKLDFSLPERYAGLVHKGMTVRFRVEGSTAVHTATVIAQEPRVDAASRSLLIRCAVTGEPELLPGASASIVLPLRTDSALLVPALAIAPSNEGRRVFIATGGSAHAKTVEVGERVGDRVQILSGLAPGDTVIVSQLLRLREGLAVRVEGLEER